MYWEGIGGWWVGEGGGALVHILLADEGLPNMEQPSSGEPFLCFFGRLHGGTNQRRGWAQVCGEGGVFGAVQQHSLALWKESGK